MDDVGEGGNEKRDEKSPVVVGDGSSGSATSARDIAVAEKESDVREEQKDVSAPAPAPIIAAT